MSIIVRAADDADVPGVFALISDRIGAEDAPEALLILEDEGFDRRRWSVAVDGDQVVSTMATFPFDIRFGQCSVRGSMIEFVATHRDYERRGLVRRQFDYHHDDVAARGELLQVIVGITYFYRRLGYEYALPVATWRKISAADVPGNPEAWSVRDAGASDLHIVMDLQRQVQGEVQMAAGLAPDLWSFILRSPVYQTFIAEADGVPKAMGRVYLDDDEPYVMDLGGSERSGIEAILAEISARAPGQDVTVLDRVGMDALLDGIGSSSPANDAYYARIGDPVAWLNAVRPELSRRLGASSLAAATGEGMISMYSSSICFTYDKGEIGEFIAGPRQTAPIHAGGSGVPPDLIASLLIGPLGFAGLAERHPDVNAGRQAQLMGILFPPQTTDVQSWVIP